MNIEVGTVLRSTKTGEMGTIVEVNDKFKTALIEMKDGRSINYSFPTLKDKRRWLPVDVKEEAEETTVVVNDEILYTAEDAKAFNEPSDEGYTQIGLKIAEQAKQKTRKSVETGVGYNIKNYVVSVAEKLGADVCESNGRFISFKINDRMFAAIFSYSKKSLTLGVRGKSIEGKANPDSTANHMMDARFKFDNLTGDVEELIDLILETAFNYQVNLKK